MCSKNKKNKITLVLGAGFAQYMHGAGTKAINELFRNDTCHKIETEHGERNLYSYFEDSLADKLTDFNFETFLAILEQLLDFQRSTEITEKDSTRNKSLSSLLYEIHSRDLSQWLFLNNAEKIWDVYAYFINKIIDEVSKYDDPSLCKDNSAAFKTYIDNLSHTYRHVKLYSTNYDSLCPDILSDVKVYLSITSKSNQQDQDFVYDLNKFKKAKLSYFPLHGRTKIKREHFNNIKYCSNEHHLDKYAIGNAAGKPNGPTLFTPIISGYNKLEHISGKPFNFGLLALAQDISESDDIITLGYSFGDPHINSILATFKKVAVKVNAVSLSRILNDSIDLEIEEVLKDIKDFIANYISGKKT